MYPSKRKVNFIKRYKKDDTILENDIVEDVTTDISKDIEEEKRVIKKITIKKKKAKIIAIKPTFTVVEYEDGKIESFLGNIGKLNEIIEI